MCSKRKNLESYGKLILSKYERKNVTKKRPRSRSSSPADDANNTRRHESRDKAKEKKKVTKFNSYDFCSIVGNQRFKNEIIFGFCF